MSWVLGWWVWGWVFGGGGHLPCRWVLRHRVWCGVVAAGLVGGVWVGEYFSAAGCCIACGAGLVGASGLIDGCWVLGALTSHLATWIVATTHPPSQPAPLRLAIPLFHQNLPPHNSPLQFAASHKPPPCPTAHKLTHKPPPSCSSMQAIYVPADDLTDPAPATTFAHLDATTVLSRGIAGGFSFRCWQLAAVLPGCGVFVGAVSWKRRTSSRSSKAALLSSPSLPVAVPACLPPFLSCF